MPAIRGRKGRGAESPRRGNRRAAPPAYDIPRLARIKLAGGLGPSDVPVSGRSLAYALTGAILFFGTAAAGAAWLGSSLFDAREAFSRSADAAAANVGFAIAAVDVVKIEDAPDLSEARAAEVRALIVPEGRHSILSLDPDDIRSRVEDLDWVATARVRRLWPATLRVEVERRREYAILQEGDELSVIDANGDRLASERPEDHPGLPRVVGVGAGPEATPLLVALEGLPELRERLKQIVRINDRRWNVELTSGAVIALPEEGAPETLAQLERLQRRHALLDRPLAHLDMRAPGRVAVRVHPELAGGPRALLGGV